MGRFKNHGHLRRRWRVPARGTCWSEADGRPVDASGGRMGLGVGTAGCGA